MAAFAEDEQPTTRFAGRAAALRSEDTATTQRRPPPIRRSSGTRPATRISDRPTARPPASVVTPAPPVSGVAPAIVALPPIATPPPPRIMTPLPIAPTREEVVATDDTMTLPRRRATPPPARWAPRIAIAAVVIACELFVVRYAPLISDLATRALAALAGD